MIHRSLFENESHAFTMEDAYRILKVFGPMPGEALAAMVDYGLSDVEIARYYGLPHEMITTLRDYWELDGNP